MQTVETRELEKTIAAATGNLRRAAQQRADELETRLMYAAEKAFVEAKRAAEKFKPFNSPHEGFAVLKEEVDELWEEIKCNCIEAAKEEAVQVAAMALRFLADC